MLKRWLPAAVCAATMIFMSGCIEYASLVKLNKDGTGTITTRMYMSDEMSAGMGMAEAFAGEMAAAMGAELDAPADPPANAVLSQVKQSMDASIMGMGEGISFVSGKEIKNEKGWPGYQAVYRFEDITKLELGKMSMSDDDGQGMSSSTSMGAEQTYRFNFTPGDTAVLEMVAVEADGASDAGTAAENEMPVDMQDDAMGAAMLQMMAPMMAGMRMTAILQVDGDIVETDAAYMAGSKNNAITIYDINLDEMLKHPEAMKYLQDPTAMEQTEGKNIPGVKAHNMGRSIKIAFE